MATSAEPPDLMARAREIVTSPPQTPPSLHEAEQVMAAETGPFVERLSELRAATYLGAAGDDVDDERVVATVDGEGKLTRMDISYRAMRDFDAGELSTACTQALNAARMSLAEAMQEAFESIPEFNLPADAQQLSADDIIRQAKEISGWRG